MSHDLERFLAAQSGVYDTALAEIRAGKKKSHWMWFVFPQLDGLGSSPHARRYAISGLAEARDYLAHPVLGRRLAEAAQAVLANDHQIFEHPDDLKLCSSMTLFAAAAADPGPFQQVIDRFFDGPDVLTQRLLDG
jgi:uncharacterized protein (DUF1810 family)